jgi:hypothetical protein
MAGFDISQAAPHLRYLVQRSSAMLHAGVNLHEPYAAAKWTRLELLGHLVDSAANNHQRIVRGLYQGEVRLPGYDQEAMVRVQRYSEAEPAVLIDLWTSYNLHLAWVLEGIGEDRLGTLVFVGVDAPSTLAQLILDYIAHLEHHLRQMFGEGAMIWSGMPWGLPAA